MKKYVKESLNEDISKDPSREKHYPGAGKFEDLSGNTGNEEVAKEIMAHRNELKEELEKKIYEAVVVIAAKVEDGEDVNEAIFNYAEQRGWFEDINLERYKRLYINLIGILEELGFELEDELMEIINNPEKY
jgi:hypothetical protein